MKIRFGPLDSNDSDWETKPNSPGGIREMSKGQQQCPDISKLQCAPVSRPQKDMIRYFFVTTFFLAVASAYAGDHLPRAVAEFCTKKLGGDIAGKNQPFNASDIVKEGIPTRRILDYSVTTETSFLWYEHGGRGYHQHLIRFSTIFPEQIEASYVFIDPQHSRIQDMIKDMEFLNIHKAKNGEL